MGRAWNEPVETITASNRDPSDFGGLPMRTDDGVSFEPMAWAKRLAKEGKGICFLDELSTCAVSTMHALLRVLLDRQVGDLTLPNTIRMISAANPADVAQGWELTPPIANRLIHLNWGVGGDYLEYWQKGIISGFDEITDFPKVQEDWEQLYLPQARVMVSSFIRANPTALFDFPKDESKRGGPWPSPRTWDFASRVLGVSWNESKEIQLPLIEGCVGGGLATSFLTWKDKLDLPNPFDLLSNPKSFSIPKETDRLFVVLNSVVATAINNPSEDNWNAAWQILVMTVKKASKDIPATAALTLANGFKSSTENYELPNDAYLAFKEIFEKILASKRERKVVAK